MSLFFTATLSAQKVGLVLSGGGAKGLAHVGVIKALEENGIPIDYITGTSMGAIVGGLYAIGYSPDEMIQLFSSPEFEKWYTGSSEEAFTYYCQKTDPGADIVSLKFDFHKGQIKMQLPTNFVSTYQMDLAFLQIFAAPSAACGYNFDKLFVPFRCVSTDINHKKSYVAKDGDLGTAIRASMTFPLYFKPVVLDSLLLFDGGMYNNFPQDVMTNDFAPDVIIGSKCANNALKADENDVFQQLENMIMQTTDYSLSDGSGILIESKFNNVSLLDFKRINEFVDSGYHNTLKKIDSIKLKAPRTVSVEEIEKRREYYKKTLPPLKFNWLSVNGKVNTAQVDYLKQIVRGRSKEPFDFDRLKDRYFKIIGSGTVSTLYPTATLDTLTGFFNANFRVVPASRFRVSLGGNISSSNAQEGFVGLEYRTWKRLLTSMRGNLYYGRLYGSGLIGIRQDIPIHPTVFYEAYGIYNRYDFYSGSPEIFVAKLKPSYLKENDYHFRAGVGIALNNNTPLKFVYTNGTSISEYYQTLNFSSSDVPDESKLSYNTFALTAERNTHNSTQFPTKGWHWYASVRYISTHERYQPGTTSKLTMKDSSFYGITAARLFCERYHTLTKNFSLGYLVDAVYSTEAVFSSYLSTVLMSPAFQPTVHSKTIFVPEYRSNAYLGTGIMPIISLNDRIFLKLGAYAFMPYREIIKNADNTASYGKSLNKVLWMGNASAVWESPLGPVSFSVNYYDKQDTKFYFVFNFGFILFNHKGIEY